MNSRSNNEIEIKVIEFMSSIRFHQSFSFDCKATRSRLRATYSISGVAESDDNSTYILVIPGLFGSRYLGPMMEHVAAREGVKIIIMDRPGVGGSTPVPLAQRMQVWLESVPALLSHLGVPYVTLVSHSCGAIYLLNTLYYLPQILQPSAPMVYLLAPWSHPSKSGVGLLKVASMLPAGLVKDSIKAVPFIATKVASALETSLGVFSSFGPIIGSTKIDATTRLADDQKAIRLKRECGQSVKENETSSAYTMKMLFTENTSGAADEALLLLKSSKEISWDACEDYMEYVSKLAARLRDKPLGKKLRVHAIFAERDKLIGQGGKRFFSDCWGRDDVRDVISFVAEIDKGSSHDTVLMPERGVISRICMETKSSVCI